MKKLATLLILLTIAIAVNAEITVYKTNAVAEQWGENYKWDEWSDWDSTEVMITLNIDNLTVAMDNNDDDKFYIISTYEELKTETNHNGKYTSMIFLAKDKEDIKCYITFIKYSEDNVQIYVAYSNYRFVYQCERI